MKTRRASIRDSLIDDKENIYDKSFSFKQYSPIQPQPQFHVSEPAPIKLLFKRQTESSYNVSSPIVRDENSIPRVQDTNRIKTRNRSHLD